MHVKVLVTLHLIEEKKHRIKKVPLNSVVELKLYVFELDNSN